MYELDIFRIAASHPQKMVPNIRQPNVQLPTYDFFIQMHIILTWQDTKEFHWERKYDNFEFQFKTYEN